MIPAYCALLRRKYPVREFMELTAPGTGSTPVMKSICGSTMSNSLFIIPVTCSVINITLSVAYGCVDAENSRYNGIFPLVIPNCCLDGGRGGVWEEGFRVEWQCRL